MAKQTGLGKGFGSLIPQGVDVALLVSSDERIEQIPVEKLSPNPQQPRTSFDETALQELAASIKQYGVIQPLVVTPNGSNYYIVAGERRWRASKLAGLKHVPALVRTTKEQERLELAILENVQRVDLSPLEQAVSIERLHQQFNMTYPEIAKRLGKADSTISNIVRLLNLPEFARDALATGKITEGHARQVLALKDNPEAQQELVGLIIKNDWTVREAERFVIALKAGSIEKKDTEERVSGKTPETERLAKRYGTKVRIYRTAHGGRVEIAFKDDDHLAKLLADLER